VVVVGLWLGVERRDRRGAGAGPRAGAADDVDRRIVTVRRTQTFRSMGTDVSVIGPDAPGFQDAVASVRDRFAAEDRRCSRFRADSELTRVNAAAGTWTSISRPFAEVVDLALAAARATDGRFDPTVHDALVAAGYDRDFDEVLAGARGELHPATHCGRWIEIERRDDELRLPAGVHLDLGAIAKGWTVDIAVDEALHRIPWVVVNAGGDLRVGGDAPAIDVAIEDPERPDDELLRTTLTSGAIATSSVVKRSWGTDAHHVIDPATGRPAATEILQATVWAPTCADAEVRATDALLSGTDAARRYPAVLVTRSAEVIVSMPVEPPQPEVAA
jgi:thiamine biosynthesis lipoprotein